MNTQSKENLCVLLSAAPQLVGALSSKGATLQDLMSLYGYFQSINDGEYSQKIIKDLNDKFISLFIKYKFLNKLILKSASQYTNENLPEAKDVLAQFVPKNLYEYSRVLGDDIQFSDLPFVTDDIDNLLQFLSFNAMKSVEFTEVYLIDYIDKDESDFEDFEPYDTME